MGFAVMKTVAVGSCRAAILAVMLFSACPVLTAQAGRAAQAGWSASSCGREPAPPAVDSGSVERYNASIDRVSAYDKSARAYTACVSRQAVAEQNAISNDARLRMASINSVAVSVQRRIADNFGALSAQLKAAGQKLGARK